MFLATVNKSKQLLCVSFIEKVTADELLRSHDEVAMMIDDLNPGSVVRHEIPIPMDRLAEHILLHYTGVAHFSGTNNWEMYKRQIDGKRKVLKGFSTKLLPPVTKILPYTG